MGKARAYDISCPCKTKCHCHHTKGGKKSQAGWGLCGGMYLLPAPPLWTPHVTAGHGRSSILRGAPGRAARAGRKAPPLPPPPRPHLGPAGGRPGQRLAPASLGRLPPHRGGRQLGCSPAQLCGRKPFALGAWSALVPPKRAGSLAKDKLRNLVWLYLLSIAFLSSQSQGAESVNGHVLGERFIAELYLQPCILVFLPGK